MYSYILRADAVPDEQTDQFFNRFKQTLVCFTPLI